MKEKTKEKDFLDCSSITEDVLLSNEIKANKLIGKIQLVLALCLLITLGYVIYSKPEYYVIETIFLITFSAVLNTIAGIYSLRTKKYSKYTKDVLIGVMILSIVLLKLLIGPLFYMWTLLPIIVSCAYNDKKITLKVSIITILLFYAGDLLSIYLKWFNDFNVLVLPLEMPNVLNPGITRSAIVSSQISVETFNNYIRYFFPSSFSIFLITGFSCYEFSKRAHENLIEQAKLIEAKARADEELSLGKDIQSNMTPINFDTIIKKCKNIDIYGLVSNVVGQNLETYDFYEIDDNHLCLFIGDISSSDTPAILFMDSAKDLITKYAYDGLLPGDILTKTNNKLCERNEKDLLITGWLGILDISTGIMNYSCAGQNQQYKSKDGKFVPVIDTDNNVLLGAIKGVEYKTNQLVFEDLDRLFLYTDGVISISNNESQMYGEKRLQDCLDNNIKLSVKDMLYNVQNDINDYSSEEEQTQSLAMLSIEFRK